VYSSGDRRCISPHSEGGGDGRRDVSADLSFAAVSAVYKLLYRRHTRSSPDVGNVLRAINVGIPTWPNRLSILNSPRKSICICVAHYSDLACYTRLFDSLLPWAISSVSLKELTCTGVSEVSGLSGLSGLSDVSGISEVSGLCGVVQEAGIAGVFTYCSGANLCLVDVFGNESFLGGRCLSMDLAWKVLS
jgi:hypothetical protein